MICQNCGADWGEDTPIMMRFESQTVRSWTSPADIAEREETILNCPKCPIPRLDEAMRRGDRRGREL
jgi:hypothetical protein